MSSNVFSGQDPSLSTGSNSSPGAFYTSGGLNDSTGREVFEDPRFASGGAASGATASGVTSGAGAGTTSETGVGAGGVGHHHGHHGHHGHHHHQDEVAKEQHQGRGLEGSDFQTGTQAASTGVGAKNLTGTDAAQYGSNTAAQEYQSATSGIGSTGTSGLASGQVESSKATGSTPAQDYQKSTTTSGIGGTGSSGLAGDQLDSSTTTGSKVQGGGLTDHSMASGDESAFSGNPTLIHGHTGSHEGGGGLTSGAAGADRFGTGEGTSTEYGNPVGEKATTNQGIGRHGNDFTGGFAATGGAYTNPNKPTGLTGRETTTTGVQDQFGEPTQKLSMVDKVKNAIGGHRNDANANSLIGAKDDGEQ